MNNSEYWQTRMEKLTNSLLLGQEKDTVSFLRAYKPSLTDIQAYISLLYSKYSTDGVLSLNDMYKNDRFKAMEKEIISIIGELGKQDKIYMTNELKKTYTESYIKTGAILTEGIPELAVNFAIIPKGFVDKALTYPWSGTDFVTRVGVNNNVLISNLRQTLTRGFIQGNSITDMTKDLKSVMDIGATNARRLIRTEAMHVIGASHNDTYKSSGVEKVKFIIAKDDRVCDDCRALAKSSKNPFLIDEAPMIPQHANSRSINIPFFED
ncbi:MAG TPA: minor capsid protein [Clostridium sp.]